MLISHLRPRKQSLNHRLCKLFQLDDSYFILGYKVYYTTRKGDPIEARRVKRTPNQKIRLEGLVANTTYVVCVSPYNSAGDGPVSDDFSVLMLTGGKLAMHIVFHCFILKELSVGLSVRKMCLTCWFSSKLIILRYFSSLSSRIWMLYNCVYQKSI